MHTKQFYILLLISIK